MHVLIQDKAERKRIWEGYCDPSKGCRTACCYYKGSACEQLEITDIEKGIGRCKVYETRFGDRHTVSGELFKCVPIHVFMQHDRVPAKCGYLGIKLNVDPRKQIQKAQ